MACRPPFLQVDDVVANTHELKRLQETPDDPEALGCVPALKLSDIKKTITNVRGGPASLVIQHD